MALGVLALGLAGCGIAQVERQPDPAEIPNGPLQAIGGEAVGPITEVGSGRTLGIGWRYAVYDSGDGICTQLELASVSSGGCGSLPLIPAEGIFGGVSSGGPGAPSEFPAPVDGIVSSRVAAVWIQTESGGRVATRLMPLAGAGHDAKAFIGFAPAGERAASLVAVDAGGEVLETFDLP